VTEVQYQACGHPQWYFVQEEEGGGYCRACHDQANEKVFVRQNVIAQGRSGKIYQLWQCRVTGYNEWREIPFLDDVREQFPGRVVPRIDA
jgi:hypothetical protein